MLKKNLDGERFNRWTIISEGIPWIRKKTNWKEQPTRNLLCRCDCWTIKTVAHWNIVNWSSKSCWCHHKEICKWLMEELHKTQKWSGNPNWKWGKTKEDAKKRNTERNTKDSRTWRKIVLKRDWMCVVCWEINNLQAHHINDWKNNISLRTDENNWVCLCKYCHHIFHKEYWFWNNTPEQFNEFKTNYVNN